jgi:Lrp/AsnC family leucine-responsive transcriptional regulator
MSGNKLDEIDHKILSLLQRDARISIAKIAAAVNVTSTPVSERISKLEEAGFIKKYIALLDRDKVGRPVLVHLFVKLNPQTAETLALFEQAIGPLPGVQSIFVVSGHWNFILHITAKTPQEYFSFLMENISSLPYVAQTDSAFVLKECQTFQPLPL